MISGIGGGLILLLWAGLCAADQRAIASRQIHQPLVAAVIAGWLLGAPDRGLLVGMWFQLVWPAPMPIGGSMIPDTGSVAVAATILAVAMPGGEGLLLAILVGLLVAWISIPWERRLRAANERTEMRVLARECRGLGRAIAGGVAGPFLRGVGCALFALVAAAIVRQSTGARAPAPSSGALTIALLGGAAVVGLSGLLARIQTEAGRRWLPWTAAGLAIGAAGRLALEAFR